MFRWTPVVTLSYLALGVIATVWRSSENSLETKIPCRATEIIVDTSFVPFVLQDCNDDVHGSDISSHTFSRENFPSLAVRRAYRSVKVTSRNASLWVWNTTLKTIWYEPPGSTPAAGDNTVIHISSCTFMADQSALSLRRSLAVNVSIRMDSCHFFLSDNALDLTATLVAVARGGNLRQSRVVLVNAVVVIRVHYDVAPLPPLVGGSMVGTHQRTMQVFGFQETSTAHLIISQSRIDFLSANINASDNATMQLQQDLSVPEANGLLIKTLECFSTTMELLDLTYYCEGASHCGGVVFGSTINRVSYDVAVVVANVTAVQILSGPRANQRIMGSMVYKLRRSASLVDGSRSVSASIVCRDTTVTATVVPLRGPVGQYDPAVAHFIDVSLLALASVQGNWAISRVAATVPSDALPPGGVQCSLHFSAVYAQGASNTTISMHEVRTTTRILALLCTPQLRWAAFGALLLHTPSHSVLLSIAALNCAESSSMHIHIDASTVAATIVPHGACSTLPFAGVFATDTF